MKRKKINFTWEDEDSQKVFAEWIPFPDAQTSAKDVDAIENLVDLKPPLVVLDVGCGNGRHAIELAKRGHRVVGIDVARRFLNEAKKAAREAGIQVEFRLQRASEIPERNVFDFALAYWHTIGFMADDEIKKHFSSVYAALKPNSIFLYTFQGPRLVPGQELNAAIPVKSWSEKNGKFILTEKSIQNGYRDEYCIVIDTNTNEVIEYNEHQRAFSYEEILGYLKDAGFSSVTAYANFELISATPEDFNIFLCKKS
jgi:SAM-dependent methyltransferase